MYFSMNICPGFHFHGPRSFDGAQCSIAQLSVLRTRLHIRAKSRENEKDIPSSQTMPAEKD